MEPVFFFFFINLGRFLWLVCHEGRSAQLPTTVTGESVQLWDFLHHCLFDIHSHSQLLSAEFPLPVRPAILQSSSYLSVDRHWILRKILEFWAVSTGHTEFYVNTLSHLTVDLKDCCGGLNEIGPYALVFACWVPSWCRVGLGGVTRTRL